MNKFSVRDDVLSAVRADVSDRAFHPDATVPPAIEALAERIHGRSQNHYTTYRTVLGKCGNNVVAAATAVNWLRERQQIEVR